MTITDLLKRGGEWPYKGGFLPLLDCEILLAFTLGVSREYLFAHGDEEVEDFLVPVYEGYLGRRAGGEPLAYLIGNKEFFGYDFYVDKRVLIPRPETEILVERVVEFVQAFRGNRKLRILDVGTGSGCVIISIVKRLMELELESKVGEFMAVDLSEEALEVARLNSEILEVEDRIGFFQSDLLEVIEEDEQLDVIVANLPYIGRERHSFVDEDTLAHEPSLALYGGDGGLELYKKMFQEMEEKGLDVAMVLGEFALGQTEELGELLNNFFAQRWRIEKDLAGIDRVFIIGEL